MLGIQKPGNGVDLCGFHRFRRCHFRQNRRNSLRQHAFAAAGTADHQGIVPAGSGDFQGIADILLSLYIGKIRGFLFFDIFFRHSCRLTRNLPHPLQVRQKLCHILHAVDRNPGSGCFCCIGGRNV